jgi:predicted MFS family arabinose efflux permease
MEGAQGPATAAESGHAQARVPALGGAAASARPLGGWGVVAAYGAVAAVTQTLWLTYAPITTETAHRYGVSVSAVGWLSEIFPLLYVLLAILAGALLDRWFRPSLAAAGGVVAVGGLLRLGGQSFAWALAGQSLVAIAQPVVMSAVSKLAGEYLPAKDRPGGIAVASAAGFVGMLIALLLGPALGGAHLMLLLAIEAAAAALAALWMALMLRRPGAPAAERVAIEGGAARALWRASEIRTLCVLAFLGFGAFVALSTWLQTLLHPDGVSETLAGVLLVGMILAGVAGCALIPPLVERAHAERGFTRAVVIVGALGSVALGVLPALGARAAALVAMGAFLLPALPVILTLAERIAGPAAGTAGAIVWLAGNLGGLIVALIVQALVHQPLDAFLALAAVLAAGLPFAGRMGRVARAATAIARAREGAIAPRDAAAAAGAAILVPGMAAEQAGVETSG